jgi:hypothetical protein
MRRKFEVVGTIDGLVHLRWHSSSTCSTHVRCLVAASSRAGQAICNPIWSQRSCSLGPVQAPLDFWRQPYFFDCDTSDPASALVFAAEFPL